VIAFSKILNIYYVNNKIKFDQYKSKHWKINYGKKFKKLTKNKIENFRNNYLSKGLDDSYYSQNVQKKIYFDALKKLGKSFITSNLNKKNIGNLKNFYSANNSKIDINELFHILWLYYLKKFLKNIKIICEIGGGYGSFAEKIIKNYNCKYILIDLPETNILSSFYISKNFPKKKIYLAHKKKDFFIDKKILSKYDIFIIPPWYSFKDFEVDFFINTRSFMEMEKMVVENYFKLIHKFISKNGFFLNINRYKKKSVKEPIFFHQYPYDRNWSVIHSHSSWMQKHCHFLLTQRTINKSNEMALELNRIKKLGIINSFVVDRIFFKNMIPYIIYRNLLKIRRSLILYKTYNFVKSILYSTKK